MNILAIGAHPDDLEICCAGTLAKYKKNGENIFMAISTNGNQGSNVYGRDEIAAIRKREAEESAGVLGADIRFMGYDDEFLIDSIDTRRSFINTIRWANPDVILTHYPEDKSTDHGMTGRLTTQELLSLQGKNILADEKPIQKLPCIFYFDTGGGISFVPEVYVDISNEIGIKIEAYSKMVSQFDFMKTYGVNDFEDYMEIISRYRGIQAGVQYAEGYIGCKLWNCLPNYKFLP